MSVTPYLRSLGALVLVPLLWLSVCRSGVSAAEPALLSPEQLREDLRAMQGAILSTHPQPEHSVDTVAMARAFADVRTALDHPMDRDEAWRVFATLNPTLADGHLFVGYPDWRGDTRAHLAGGGVLFPYEVQVDGAGQPYVRAVLGGAPTRRAGARIKTINGMDGRAVATELLSRVHGDSPAFRASLLSRRWWFYYWKVFGAPDVFELRLDRDMETETVPASRAMPQILADETLFERTYGFELRPGKIAVLRLGAFSWEDEAAFFDFTANAFRRIREAGAETLVIDLRDNGGGDDAYWKKGVMPYIANTPYLWGSTFRKRVLEKYRDAGETTGDVVSGRLDAPVEPAADRRDVFRGRIYVLIGPATYSSAVLFANVVQDYGFARLVGSGGAVRSRQSGGVERFRLAHTGLAVWVPRFVLERPRPIVGDEWVRPDVALSEDFTRCDTAGCAGLIDAMIAKEAGD